MTLPANHPLNDGRTTDAPLIRAYRGERQATPPVWFMRQAGRSLPEYRELRVGNAMLDACLNPELSSEITLQPVRRHGVDAAIFFSDIVIPIKLAGVEVEIVPGRGPVLADPIRSVSDVAKLRPLDPAALAPIIEGVARTVAELGTTPTRWLNRQRLLRAQELLEDSSRSVEAIAVDTGFGGAAVMRHHFLQVLQTTPTAYRRAFGPRRVG